MTDAGELWEKLYFFVDLEKPFDRVYRAVVKVYICRPGTLCGPKAPLLNHERCEPQ